MMPGIYISTDAASVEGTPVALVCKAMERLFETNPDLSRNVDLSLVPTGPSSLQISMIDSHGRRGRGLGSRALDELCRMADIAGITLWVQAVSLRNSLKNPRGALDQDQLDAFYGRRAFIADPSSDRFGYMERLPESRRGTRKETEQC